MGVIDITTRRVSLGNLPGVRAVNTDTGAGARAAAGVQLGRAVAGFGMELNRTANALEERRQRNAAWDYINRFQAAMRADDEEDAKKGVGEDPQKWVEGRVKRRGEIEKQIASETGIDKKSLALAEKHLAGFNLATQSRWAARALDVTKRREMTAAKVAVDNAGTALLDAMDTGDEVTRIAALKSWDEALANLAGQDETLGEKGIDALRRTKAEELLRSSLARKLEELSAKGEDDGVKKVEEDFEAFRESFAKDGWKALVNGTYKDGDGERDLMERDLRGMDEKAFKMAAKRDIETARQKAVARAERRDVEEVETVLNEGTSAAAMVRDENGGYPDNRVQAIENVITRLEVLARDKPKGSVAAAKAAAGVDRLNDLADQVARWLDWEAIVADDGAGKYKPPEGSRMAKFHAALKASYEEQKERYYAGAFAAEDAARREERKSTEIALRVNMLASAQLAPGEFSARLADAAAKGDISLGQYFSLRDEFEDVWQKEGMPRKAAALVDVLKREFFAGKDYDLSERLGVNPKTGKFEYGRNPDTKKPYEGEDAEYKTTELVPVKNRATPFGSFVADNSGRTRPVTTANTLTSNEQMQLLNRMMELAKHDGEDTYIDPLTKEVLSSPRKIDAVDEFQRLCSMIKTEKRTEAAISVVDRVCDAMLAVDGGWRRFEDASVESAARRESAEVAARAATRQARRGSFKPKMPTSAGGAKAGLPEDENMED